MRHNQVEKEHMGQYTEFVFAVKLKRDTPKNVIEILKFLKEDTDEEEYDVPELPKHDFFNCDRWSMLFLSDSAYFDGITNSILEFDNITESYFLTVRSNLKNYDNEIVKFLNWIKPYIDNIGHSFLGYFKYEECDNPRLIYYDEIK
ncbi:hypothetical protein KGF51_09825 [Clostridioides sp. ZZV14-6045]|uniref:hypothetical protein n=1 Tax=Clostridioides TaxID=1870884 RepID=UPI001C18BAE9|nr:hypothetical protein [Clostridioides sp. ZZV14-6045]HBG8471541.1 hypothetical protein [Clostridioides difficile]